jgi:Tol biopolymer transport system component
VKILDVPSGAVVGLVGGSKVDNTEPSLAPDGRTVVFARIAADGSGRRLGIWTAAADGSRLQRLERSGAAPLWSPAGDRIAYLAPTGALQLVAAQGGTSATLLRGSPGTISVFGWSPDGRHIAVAEAGAKLAVVDVATRKARTLLTLRLPYSSSSVAWSPDSRRLLVVWRPPSGTDCPSGLWRVPADGAKPQLVHGC